MTEITCSNLILKRCSTCPFFPVPTGLNPYHQKPNVPCKDYDESTIDRIELNEQNITQERMLFKPTKEETKQYDLDRKISS